jgi:hypothetical protein
MGGSPVEIQITKSGTQVATFSYQPGQNYGRIMLSSFNHTFGAGSFRATGRLVTGGKTVASRDYTVE